MKSEVVVIGSSNTDMVVKLSSLPSPGETVLGGDFVVAAGGKGANQAVAAARLGATVGLVARIGSDMFGDQSLENFKSDGILTEYVFRDQDLPSGVALIMVDDHGENMIAVASGANNGLSNSDVEAARDLIASSRVILLQLEIPLNVVGLAAELGAMSGATVILNPAPAQELDATVLGNTSILTPNEKEAAALSGIEPRDAETAELSARRLREKGVDCVVITMGAKGAFLHGEGFSGLIPAPAVQPLDTTAAGDAFNGALAYAISKQKDLPDAVSFANQVAALSVTRIGAQPSLPTLEEVEMHFSASGI
jgi:ribokinase